jgi:hypothetical protein
MELELGWRFGEVVGLLCVSWLLVFVSSVFVSVDFCFL